MATRRRSTWLARVTIGDDTIHVDFTGTSGMSSYAINCPMCYTEAYTTFGVNCVVAPHVPNNAGTLDAVRVTAPPGTVVSAEYPAAVYARSTMGHMLPDVVYGCLDQAIPGRVPAEGHVQSLEPETDRRPRPDRHRRQGRHPVHGHELPFRRSGCSAASGRLVRDAVSVRRPERSGGGDRGDHAAGDLAQGTAAGFAAAPAVSAAAWAR